MLQIELDPPQGQTPGVDRLRPVEAFKGSLAQKTYQTLREAIIGLSYRPGEALKKPEICERLGVSRSPVSEAIARLAAEGLVDVVPQAGTFVARFSMEDIREGAFRREAIELAAVEEIAPRMTEAQLVELRRTMRVQEILVQDGDFAGFYKMDGEMHAQILSMTGHRKLVQVADTAWVHVNRARQLVLPMQGRVKETLAEHRAILDALEARDPEGARQSMRRHLRQLLTNLEPLVRNHPWLFQAERKG